MAEHIVKSYQEKLDRLTERIARMGVLAERQFANAIRATAERDDQLANSTVAGDAELDALDFQTSKEAVSVLALRQPMALDLRETVAAIRIAAELERIGDLAKNIAKRVQVVNRFPKIQPVEGVVQIGRMVARQIHEAVHAYIERDAQRALETWRHDTEIDDYFDSLFREILHYMMGAPDAITICTHLAFMAKNIERVGDHCTTVAASTYYLVTGEPIHDARPKGVDPRFTVVEERKG